MARVRGIGGIFFKSPNPQALQAWYAKHLGIESKDGFGAMFAWKQPDEQNRDDLTIWSVFPSDTKYFEPSSASFMLNYIVDNLAGTLEELRAAGVAVDSKVETHEYGSFGWITDPDGNRVELWEPKPAVVSSQED